MSVWDEIDDVLERYDAGVSIQSESLCAWSGQLRLTMTNPKDAPSRSVTFFAAGAASPEQVAERVLADARVWLSGAVVKPLPLPSE